MSTKKKRPASVPKKRKAKRPAKVAAKRPAKRPVKRPVLIQRPAAWWREPLSRAELRDTEGAPGERDILVAHERAVQAEKYKQMIRDLRKVSDLFDVKHGYPLDTNQLIRISSPKIRALERAHKKLQNVQSHPFVEARPRTKAQLKSVLQQSAKVVPGQKVFFIHTEEADKKRVHFKDGRVIIETTVKGGTLFRADYLFSRKARSWEDVKRLTKEVQKKGMREGAYRIFTSIYGAVGNLVDRDKMLEELDEFYSTYREELANYILGWKWYSSSFELARKKVKREKGTAERFKEIRSYNRRMKWRRVLEKLGKAKKCKYCKKKKCVCKAPSYK